MDAKEALAIGILLVSCNGLFPKTARIGLGFDIVRTRRAVGKTTAGVSRSHSFGIMKRSGTFGSFGSVPRRPKPNDEYSDDNGADEEPDSTEITNVTSFKTFGEYVNAVSDAVYEPQAKTHTAETANNIGVSDVHRSYKNDTNTGGDIAFSRKKSNRKISSGLDWNDGNTDEKYRKNDDTIRIVFNDDGIAVSRNKNTDEHNPFSNNKAGVVNNTMNNSNISDREEIGDSKYNNAIDSAFNDAIYGKTARHSLNNTQNINKDLADGNANCSTLTNDDIMEMLIENEADANNHMKYNIIRYNNLKCNKNIGVISNATSNIEYNDIKHDTQTDANNTENGAIYNGTKKIKYYDLKHNRYMDVNIAGYGNVYHGTNDIKYNDNKNNRYMDGNIKDSSNVSNGINYSKHNNNNHADLHNVRNSSKNVKYDEMKYNRYTDVVVADNNTIYNGTSNNKYYDIKHENRTDNVPTTSNDTKYNNKVIGGRNMTNDGVHNERNNSKVNDKYVNSHALNNVTHNGTKITETTDGVGNNYTRYINKNISGEHGIHVVYKGVDSVNLNETFTSNNTKYNKEDDDMRYKTGIEIYNGTDALKTSQNTTGNKTKYIDNSVVDNAANNITHDENVKKHSTEHVANVSSRDTVDTTGRDNAIGYAEGTIYSNNFNGDTLDHLTRYVGNNINDVTTNVIHVNGAKEHVTNHGERNAENTTKYITNGNNINDGTKNVVHVNDAKEHVTDLDIRNRKYTTKYTTNTTPNANYATNDAVSTSSKYYEDIARNFTKSRNHSNNTTADNEKTLSVLNTSKPNIMIKYDRNNTQSTSSNNNEKQNETSYYDGGDAGLLNNTEYNGGSAFNVSKGDSIGRTKYVTGDVDIAKYGGDNINNVTHKTLDTTTADYFVDNPSEAIYDADNITKYTEDGIRDMMQIIDAEYSTVNPTYNTSAGNESTSYTNYGNHTHVIHDDEDLVPVTKYVKGIAPSDVRNHSTYSLHQYVLKTSDGLNRNNSSPSDADDSNRYMVKTTAPEGPKTKPQMSFDDPDDVNRHTFKTLSKILNRQQDDAQPSFPHVFNKIQITETLDMKPGNNDDGVTRYYFVGTYKQCNKSCARGVCDIVPPPYILWMLTGSNDSKVDDMASICVSHRIYNIGDICGEIEEHDTVRNILSVRKFMTEPDHAYMMDQPGHAHLIQIISMYGGFFLDYNDREKGTYLTKHLDAFIKLIDQSKRYLTLLTRNYCKDQLRSISKDIESLIDDTKSRRDRRDVYKELYELIENKLEELGLGFDEYGERWFDSLGCQIQNQDVFYQPRLSVSPAEELV